MVLSACGGGSSGTPAAAPSTSASGAAASTAPPATDVSPAGDIPDTQVFVAFAPPDGSFTIKVPEGWARSADAAATVFAEKYNGIRIESMAAPTAPSETSLASSDVVDLRNTVAGFAGGKVSTVQRSAGPTLLVTYRGTSATDPVTHKQVTLDFERYVYWKNGREVIVTLSAPVGADNVDPWRTVTDSFGWSG